MGLFCFSRKNENHRESYGGGDGVGENSRNGKGFLVWEERKRESLSI